MHTIIIILKWSEKDLANQMVLQAFDPVGGVDTFTIPLYAADSTDDSVPTHTWCSALFDDQHYPLLAGAATHFDNPIIVEYTDPKVPDQTLAANGLRRKKFIALEDIIKPS